MFQLVNLAHKLSLFSEQWQPNGVAEMNDYQFKVVRIAGGFIWHSHPDTDETLMVVEGVLRVDFRVGHVLVKAGEMIVVPRGVE
ncbi:cupin domain-containing protein, partial [Klebsiella pneumoniae]|uniref:cupin domain-containing protein n=1 Tax=Klebsiella pneumoniae TaxID=573 RepID=UPI00272F8CF6